MKKEAVQKLVLALAVLFVVSILIATLVGVSQISQELRRFRTELGLIEWQLDGIETDLSYIESDLRSIESDLRSIKTDLWSIKLRLPY